MKIKIKELSYDKLVEIEHYKHKNPRKMSGFFKTLVRIISKKDLKETNFKYEVKDIDNLKDEPCLILMNHSSFIDLEMVFEIFKDRKFNIIATDDGFVGKEFLLRGLGCIPTKKFISDMVIVKDAIFAVNKLKSSVLMFPEATYSFDGRTALLPKSIGKFIKILKVPVILVKTEGTFLRDPLYNNLQKRKVDVSAKVSLLFSKDEALNKSVDELNEKLKKSFEYDHFSSQIENGTIINEPFRADYLNRILYKCPHCLKENKMIGKGTTIKCMSCSNEYELLENGILKNTNGNTLFDSIPKWYDFEKKELYKEIDNGTYEISTAVEVYALRDFKALYHLGEGHLTHNVNGFKLSTSSFGYSQTNKVSYSLYSDYYWYELGDMICIGDNKTRYYCIIKDNKDIASKARLAVEYLYERK